MSPPPLLVVPDPRGRVSLGRMAVPGRQYLVHKEDDGRIVLEPAVVVSEADHRLFALPDVRRAVEQLRDRPETVRERAEIDDLLD